jgi:hypothetical protein
VNFKQRRPGAFPRARDRASLTLHPLHSRPDNVGMERRSGWRVVVMSTVALVASVCIGPPAVREPTGSPSQLPSPAGEVCAQQIRPLVAEFIDGYNAGQLGLADRFFAPAPRFEWYSERPLRQSPSAFDRSTLETYLRQRHADGDRLTLVGLQVHFVGGGAGHFSFVLDRGGTQLQSKGVLDCVSGKFFVWSIGPNPGPTQ